MNGAAGMMAAAGHDGWLQQGAHAYMSASNKRQLGLVVIDL
jgi:hypothetical protein